MSTIIESTFKVAEDGRNGTVTLGEKGIDRVLRKTIGKDDRQFIAYRSISSVHHDRKLMGRDQVEIHVGHKSYTWKIKTDAEGFVNTLNDRIG